MNHAAAPAATPAAGVFRDGLGERRTIDHVGVETLDVLRLRAELTAVPSFEFSLRERVGRLAALRHPCLARVRSVERLAGPPPTLALVSEATPGVRLSELLAAADRHGLTLNINLALGLIRQVVAATALLHEHGRDIAHGAIAPERIVITPDGRLILVEHVLGAALEQLRFSHERYWKELRVAAPRSVGLPVLDQSADVLQVGMVALSLVLGRSVRLDEYPSAIGDAVAWAWAISPRGDLEPVPTGLRSWLAQALQLDTRDRFASAIDAQAQLDHVLGAADEAAGASALDLFLTRYRECTGTPPSAAAGSTKAPPPAPPAPEDRTPAAPPAREAPPVPRPGPALLALDPAPAPGDALPAEPDEDVAETAPPPRRLSIRTAAVAAVIVAVLVGAPFAGRRYLGGTGGASTGTLSVMTNPAGAQVILDGEAHGVTPVTLTVRAGNHVLAVGGNGGLRTIPVTVAAGAQVSQYIDVPVGSRGLSVGQIEVRTDPAGARVTVDGTPRGVTPTTIPDLPAGEHVVVLENDMTSTTETVVVEPGATASIVAHLRPPQGMPLSGWISVSAPADVQLYEDGRLLGSSQSERLMVAAGGHQLDIVNQALGYRGTRTVQVSPGKVSAVRIEFPTGTMALNAIPWADVWIDNERVGETPIGNLSVPVGQHEIVFRHPELGERREVATVTLTAPVRLSVDLRKK